MRFITRVHLSFLFMAVATAGSIAQETGLDDLIPALLAENIEIRRAEVLAVRSALGYESVVDGARPRLSASIAPLYGLSTRRGSDLGAIEAITDFPPAPETTITHSFGAGLTYRQLLPTTGTLSASAQTRFDVSRTGEGDPSYSLSPSISLSATQPLFVAGDLVDLESRSLTERAARLTTDRAELAVQATGNRLIRQLAALYVQAADTVRVAALQDRQIDLAGQRLSSALISARQGRGADSDVVRQEVSLGTARSRRLSTDIALLELSDRISSLVGRSVRADELSDRLPSVRIEGQAAPAAVTTERLSLEEARSRVELARRTPGATVALSLALSPRYRDDRQDAASVGGAFTDFTGDGAGVDVQFSATVDVPILAGRTDKIADAQAEADEELAALRLKEAEDSAARRLALLRNKRELDARRLSLLRDELAYQLGLVEREESLLDAESSTVDLVDAVRLQAEALANQVWQIEAEVFLLDLEIADLSGHTLADVVVY